MYAELFCAALESAAFRRIRRSSPDRDWPVRIPEQCGVAGAVRNAIASHQSGSAGRRRARRASLKLSRQRQLVRQHLGGGPREGVCRRAAPVGCHQQHRYADHWPAVRRVRLRASDEHYRQLWRGPDCAAAGTLGALFGILHGVEAIPERGSSRSVVASRPAVSTWASSGTTAISSRPRLMLTDRVTAVTRRVIQEKRLPIALVPDQASGAEDASEQPFCAADSGASIHGNATSTVHKFEFFTIAVDSFGDATIKAQEPKALALRSRTHPLKTPERLHVRWYGPADADVPGHRQRRADEVRAADEPAGGDQIGGAAGHQPVRGRGYRRGAERVMLVPVVLLRG